MPANGACIGSPQPPAFTSDPSFPLGHCYLYAAFEKATTRAKGKKYLNTCRLEPTPVSLDGSILGNWLLGEYGVFKVVAKHVTVNQRKRQDRKKPTQEEAQGHAEQVAVVKPESATANTTRSRRRR
jgi:hypothetical protein